MGSVRQYHGCEMPLLLTLGVRFLEDEVNGCVVDNHDELLGNLGVAFFCTFLALWPFL